jgi:hypothetical protein
MNQNLSSFAARLREIISRGPAALTDRQFSGLALELFALQFRHNPVYQSLCAARKLTPPAVEHWTRVPFVPTSAFKELELSCLPPAERTAVFHSSGTTEQKPSRHFHSAESLAVYEASLWSWFAPHFRVANRFIFLTPDMAAAPRSSLVHMFEIVRQNIGGSPAADAFLGRAGTDGVWTVELSAVQQALQSAVASGRPLTLLGTAFSFVHLLDFLAEKNLRFDLPAGSQVMETGGYKNRSRVLSKAELHTLIAEKLGVGRENIICEYGMSELSSQAYDSLPMNSKMDGRAPHPGPLPIGSADSADAEREKRSQRLDVVERGVVQGSNVRTFNHLPSSILHPRIFRFRPWVRAQMMSPETGREVADGETGLIRIFDLANAFSVAAIQTEDLGIRRGDGFELIGRAQLAEPRGCSLMTA